MFREVYDRQQLFPSGAVIFLSPTVGSTSVGDDALLSALYLGEDCADGRVTGIRI